MFFLEEEIIDRKTRLSSNQYPHPAKRTYLMDRKNIPMHKNSF